MASPKAVKRETASMAALREGLGRMNVLDGSGDFVADKPKRRDNKSRDVSIGRLICLLFGFRSMVPC